MSSEERCSNPHFIARQFGDTSTFSSRFPVNLQCEAVRETIDEFIPNIDAIFQVRGFEDRFETVGKLGVIALQPLSTHLAMDVPSTDIPEKRIMRSRHFTLASLTDGALLRTAQVRAGRKSGQIKDFSLYVNGLKETKNVDYELRAVINDVFDENVYEVAQHTGEGEAGSILIDEAAAKDFVHALREVRVAKEVDNPSLEVGLLRLFDESNLVSHKEAGAYDVNGGVNLTLDVQRTSKLVRGSSIAQKVVMLLQETSFNDRAETIRNFYFAHNTLFAKQPYTARLDYLVRAFDETLPHEEREATFEALSIFFRENPEIIFRSLGAACSRLATTD